MMDGIDGGRRSALSDCRSSCNLHDVTCLSPAFHSFKKSLRLEKYSSPMYLLLQFLNFLRILDVLRIWLLHNDRRRGALFPAEPVRELRPVRKVFE